MSHRFVRCPHCKMPHDAAERICPTTGRRIEPSAAQTDSRRPRMSELPPPERRPEPLGFNPVKHRIPERSPVREAEPRRAPAHAPAAGTRVTSQTNRTGHLDLVGRTVSDRYLVKRILGEGGMGTVYEAEHTGLGRPVAIKVLNPSQAKKRTAVKRFQQEARAAGAIGHPNICEVYDLGSLDDGSPYLVMEKLIGTTLADRISKEGGLPFDEIADYLLQVLAGLVAAHEKGIVHRDIKPENIFLARRAGSPVVAKILDFGVSKMMPQFQGSDDQLDLTRTGMVMGTPYYMSPEQARGERNLDGRVDVYACGVMMYEAIVGKRPFLAPNYNALLLSIISTTPRSIREVRPATPPAMESIVARMMAKARDDRYATAYAVMRDLQSLALSGSGQVGRAAPPPPPPPIAAPMRSRGQDLGTARPSARDREREEAAARTTGGRRRLSPATEGSAGTLRSATRSPSMPKDDSVSIDIPIHVVTDLATGHGNATDNVDELPTEIFRPGAHPFLSAKPASAPPPAPVPAPPRVAPANFAHLGDDWDSETVVKQPAALTTLKHRDRPSSRQKARPPAPAAPVTEKVFNPDETVILHSDNVEFDVDVDFGDDTHNLSNGPAPRRR